MMAIDTDKSRTEEKLKFVELRAQGYPYSKIATELKVSKSTLSAWNTELKEEIAKHKAERLRELYTSYYMVKEARIKELGETLERVDSALEQKDLAEMPIDKLLDFKLRLMKELKGEYVELDTETSINLNAEAILTELLNLLGRFREGDIDNSQALRETAILGNALKAYETSTLEKKFKLLESVIRR